MPVPSNIAELSKVASENSPAGTESVKGTPDDYFRAHASFIRQLFDQLLGPTVTLPSAATVNIGFAGSANISITGTTAITAFDAIAEGTLRWVTFAGALTLTYDAAKLQLPGAANIVTTAGDVAVFKSLGAGNWKCLAYQRVTGTGPFAATAVRDGYLSAADWAVFNAKLSTAAAASAYLPLGGGNMTGPLVLNNGVGIQSKLAAGAVNNMIRMGADNVTYQQAAGWAWNSLDNTARLATLTAAGAFSAVSVTENSDVRKKKLFRRRPADFLQRVAGIKKLGDFLWRKDDTPGIGTSAQELEAIWPEAVQTSTEGVKSVRYGAASFVIAVELARAFFAYAARTDKRLAKLETK